MAGRGEYEPRDSREVTGEKPTARPWHEAERGDTGGEYEPKDSRNVTGTADTPDGRWSDSDAKPPRGVPQDKPMDAADAARGGAIEAQRRARAGAGRD